MHIRATTFITCFCRNVVCTRQGSNVKVYVYGNMNLSKMARQEPSQLYRAPSPVGAPGNLQDSCIVSKYMLHDLKPTYNLCQDSLHIREHPSEQIIHEFVYNPMPARKLCVLVHLRGFVLGCYQACFFYHFGSNKINGYASTNAYKRYR